jgi:hypothetical protein
MRTGKPRNRAARGPARVRPSVANSTASRPRHGPRRRITSVLNNPITVSRQRVIVRIAATADGQFDARVGESLGVADREILRAAIAVMHEIAGIVVAPVVDGLLERI